MKKTVIAIIIMGLIVLVLNMPNPYSNNKKSVDNTNQQNESEDIKEFIEADNYYIVNPKESKLTWKGTQNTINNEHTGTVNISSGTLIEDDNKFVAGEFYIDMTSIQDDGNNEFLEEHLRGPDFFEVEKYPTAKLSLVEVSETDTTNIYKVRANLTIKKITKPVEFITQVYREGSSIVATADFSIDRTEWDIRYGSGKFFQDIGDKLIEDKIYYNVQIKAQK